MCRNHFYTYLYPWFSYSLWTIDIKAVKKREKSIFLSSNYQLEKSLSLPSESKKKKEMYFYSLVLIGK